jgi:hypothetical protein
MEEDEGVSDYLAWVVGGVNTSLGESIVWKEKVSHSELQI